MKNNILIIGSSGSRNLQRLIKLLTLNQNNFNVDLLDKNSRDQGYLITGCNEIFKLSPVKNHALRNKYSKKVVYIIQQIFTILKILKKNKYHLINIHFISKDSITYLFILKLFGIKVMITPWGSDVYRCAENDIRLLKIIYRMADFVSIPKINFRKDIIDKFKFDESKIIDMGFGSEVISEIINYNKNRNETLLNFGLPTDSFIIACGYSANKEHKHLEFLEQISNIKESLPKSTVLLFQMTYGPDRGAYVNLIEEKAKQVGIKSIFLKDYLENDTIAHIRLIVDIFIHLQPSDAFSASLQEYLLTSTLCINGKWLKYPDLEQFGIPYLTLNKIDDLSDLLVKIINREIEKPEIDERLLLMIQQNDINISIKKWTVFFSNTTF